MTLGIIAAMDAEADMLKAAMENPTSRTISGIEYRQGKIYGTDVAVAVCGPGKVNAAVCAQTMILACKPDAVINIGVAGGLSGDFKIGDIAVASAVAEHDMDTSPLGDEVGFISGLNTVYMKSDAELSEIIRKAAEAIPDIHVKTGVIATGDQFVCSDDVKKRIADTFGAIAVEMEGGSIGHVCTMNNVPFCVLRAISDGANDDAGITYPVFMEKAAKNSIEIVMSAIKSLSDMG